MTKQNRAGILRKTSSQVFDLIVLLLQHLFEVLEWCCLTHFFLQFLQYRENNRGTRMLAHYIGC